jgi:hypothetical protein
MSNHDDAQHEPHEQGPQTLKAVKPAKHVGKLSRD